jgi:hypothetical protein
MVMRRPPVALLTLGVLVVVASCGSPSTAGQINAASPSRLQASRRPTLWQSCRLPVIAVHLTGQPPGGWLTLPAGTFQSDPASAGVDQFNIVSWDEAGHRWVPADAKSVSPDGRSYFVASPDHDTIVDSSTGATIHEVSNSGGLYGEVVGFTSKGVYLQSRGMAQPGLWLFSTATGQLTQVSSADGFWEIIDESTAWGVSNSGPATVRVLDLQTGVGRDVLALGDKGGSVAGYVGHRALIVEGDAQSRLSASIVGADGSTQPVAVPPDWSRAKSTMDIPIAPTGYAQDGSGIWLFGHGFVLAQYDPVNGLRELTTQLPPLAPTGPAFEVFAVAGRCVAS